MYVGSLGITAVHTVHTVQYLHKSDKAKQHARVRDEIVSVCSTASAAGEIKRPVGQIKRASVSAVSVVCIRI